MNSFQIGLNFGIYEQKFKAIVNLFSYAKEGS